MKKYLITSVFIAACSTINGPPPRTDSSLSVWVSDFFQQQKKIRIKESEQVQGRLKLSYQGPKDRVLGRGFLFSEFISDALLELRDPFGKLHFQARLAGENFWAIYPQKKLAYQDERSGKNFFAQTLGISLSFREIHLFSLGIIPDRFIQGAKEPTGIDERKFILKSADGSLEVTVRRDWMVIAGLHWKGNRDSWGVKYSDFRPCCGGVDRGTLAYLMEMEGGSSHVEFEWQDLKFASSGKPSVLPSLKLEPDLEIKKL